MPNTQYKIWIIFQTITKVILVSRDWQNAGGGHLESFFNKRLHILISVYDHQPHARKLADRQNVPIVLGKRETDTNFHDNKNETKDAKLLKPITPSLFLLSAFPSE